MADLYDPWARFPDAPPLLSTADNSSTQAMAAMREALGLDGRSLEGDGGDLSGPTARRLPGERAVAPRGSAVMPGYPQEDIEARAWARRTGYEHIPFANAAIGMAGLTQAPFKAARDMVHGTAESVERLGRQGYHPEIDDEAPGRS